MRRDSAFTPGEIFLLIVVTSGGLVVIFSMCYVLYRINKKKQQEGLT
jgi:hypothetical protein